MSGSVLYVGLALLTVVGALAVVAAREMTRMLLGLGAFLLGIAGLYAAWGLELLAVAELFVYVGGVLVLFVFAIASMGRDREARALARRFDIGAALTSIALAVALWSVLPWVYRDPMDPAVSAPSVERTAVALLGPLLPYFEVVGVVLLIALAAGLAIVGRGG